jgi:hypothetical protein
MAHFAPVAPIQVLEQIYEHHPKVFGEYHLLLAHHTVAEAERFRRLFERINADGVIHPTVIMDNSVVECGGYVDFNMMQQAVGIINDSGIDVIPVLPDVMGKGQETREATQEAYAKWANEISCAGFMAVCQGENWDDYCTSVELFSRRAKFPLMEYIGVPRILVKTLGTRKRATPIALKHSQQSGIKVHLLGYSDETYDDLFCSQIPGVEGIDSAVPLRVEGQFRFGGEDGPRPKDWFDTASFNPQMGANLGFVRHQHGFWDGKGIF